MSNWTGRFLFKKNVKQLEEENKKLNKTVRELVQALDLIGVWCVALGSKDTKDYEEALKNIDVIAWKAIKIYESSQNGKNTY